MQDKILLSYCEHRMPETDLLQRPTCFWLSTRWWGRHPSSNGAILSMSIRFRRLIHRCLFPCYLHRCHIYSNIFQQRCLRYISSRVSVYPEGECRPDSWYRMSISMGVIWPNLLAAWTNSSAERDVREKWYCILITPVQHLSWKAKTQRRGNVTISAPLVTSVSFRVPASVL